MIGIIGCGNMGQALIRGMIAGRRMRPGQVGTWDPNRRLLGEVGRRFKIRAVRSNTELAEKSRILFLAVKPQQMAEVLAEIRPHLAHRPLLISIAAGTPTAWIEKRLGRGIPVVRVMPNTPALVGKGISALAAGRRAKHAHLVQAERLFRSVGKTIRVPERWMDAVTAVSGSGPAYFFYLMEQMIAAGVELGLSSEVARALVLGTSEGAAALAGMDPDPAGLRARVTSKGGTTEAAFRVFSKKKVGENLRAGIRAAARRAKELSA